MSSKIKYITTNPNLRIIKQPWTENPLDKEGLYCNLNGNSLRSFKELLKWQFGENPHKKEKKTEAFRHKVISDGNFLSSKKDGIIWLGHASFIIHLEGLRIITDPVFWNVSALKRMTPLPCKPEDITGVDMILLSHNHRDHADEKSMKLMCLNNPQAIILTGLQIGNLLRAWKIKNTIQEAGWYQEYQTSDLKISYHPARHWNRRFLNDTNTMLWGSFMLCRSKKKIYFGADSAYDSHFKEIGDLFENIDISILGCGAYKPEWFMNSSHTSPAEAVKAFNDTEAKILIPMHIGTFDLSDEPMSEPFRLLKEYEAENKIKGELKILDIGEEFNFN